MARCATIRGPRQIHLALVTIEDGKIVLWIEFCDPGPLVRVSLFCTPVLGSTDGGRPTRRSVHGGRNSPCRARREDHRRPRHPPHRAYGVRHYHPASPVRVGLLPPVQRWANDRRCPLPRPAAPGPRMGYGAPSTARSSPSVRVAATSLPGPPCARCCFANANTPVATARPARPNSSTASSAAWPTHDKPPWRTSS